MTYIRFKFSFTELLCLSLNLNALPALLELAYQIFQMSKLQVKNYQTTQE